MITKKKLSYEGPVCEVFEVQSEAVMQAGSPGSGYNRNGGAGNDLHEQDDYTYGF